MLKKLIVTAALASLVSTAFAATPNTFYAGIDGGSTKADDFENSKGSYGGFLGYNFHENFAVEIGARRLGKWNEDDLEAHADQYAISLIGALPLQNNLNVFGRLGYNRLKAEASLGSVSLDDTQNGALYGVGVGYNFTPTISARLEFQKPSSDSHNVSVGLAYQF